MNDTKQFFKGVFAVLLGSLLGGLIAKDASWFVMFLGILTGGMAGWVLYGPIVLLRAVRDSWLERSEDFRRYVKQIVARIVIMASITFSAIVILTDGYALLGWKINDKGLPNALSSVIMICWFAVILFSIFASPNKRPTRFFWKCAFWTTPIGILAALFYGIAHVIKNTFANRKEIGLFFFEIYKAIHCKDRYLCFVDSMAGVLLSTAFSGNVWLGAVLGTAFWIANRELVAKRWLKIIPQAT